MKISVKLYISFFSIIAVAFVVGFLGILGMQRLLASGLSMYEKQIVGIEYAEKAASAFGQLRLDIRLVVVNSLQDDKKGAIDLKEQFDLNVVQFLEAMNRCKELAETEELHVFYKNITELFENKYLPIAEVIAEKSINSIPDHTGSLHLNVMFSLIHDIANRINNFLTGMMDLNAAIAHQTSLHNAEITQRFITMQTLLLILAFVCAFFTVFYIVQSIMTPINESADVLHKIAGGNFEARVAGNYTNEFAIIKASVNSTAKDIKTYINVISGIEYASKIQKNLLPPDSVFAQVFSDHYCIWKPKDIVGGDIYWMKNFEEGAVLCVCDCTGHGTPGALLTMLVVSAFDTAIIGENYKDTAQVIWELEKRLVADFNVTAANTGHEKGITINDGCDLAVLYIAKDSTVSLSAANTNVFICDGKNVTRFRGQKLRIGDGKLKGKEEIKTITIPANPDNKFYIASDGLYEQPGGFNQLPFGYERFEEIILETHNEKQNVISQKIWQAFEKYREDSERCDDFQLITFKPQV
ncbi:MAG: MCP four helix bundle domain-containing protein [Treponema sp.]|nr:MCP four helix bundle domain-containing protein [Treponema sp.]